MFLSLPHVSAAGIFRKYAGGTLWDTLSRAFPPPVYFMFYYELESTAERRARRNNDIKTLFFQLTIEEGMSFMDAYEAVGYHFYLSSEQIRQIIAGRC